MAPTYCLLAVALTLSSYVQAFSPDQCNVTDYGKPNKAACTTLLTSISNLGVGNTSYLFIPAQFPTPAGLSNGTRKNFPVTWSAPGCNAAVVPIEVTPTSVTYDTSTYQDLAAAGTTVVQQCISNSTGGGGWELAGDDQDLVFHVYATGSQIDSTIKQQSATQIAATSEDEIDDAEEDDPAFAGDGDDDTIDGSDFLGNSTDAGNSTGSSSDVPAAAAQASSPVTSAAAAGASSPATAAAPKPTASAAGAAVVPSSGTFNYLGCQLDSTSAHTLSSLSWSGTGLTVERCAKYCAAYKYMGVESGSQCYCGGDANGKGVKPATLVTSTTNKCVTPCNGDSTQLCGGQGWMNVYQNTQDANAGATA